MKIADILKAGQEEVLKAVSGISDDDAENIPVEKQWTVKDLVGNLAVYEQVLEDIFSSRIVVHSSAPMLYQIKTMKPEEFESFHFQEFRKIPYNEILADLSVRNQHLISMMWQMTDDLLDQRGVIPWYGQDASIREYILNTHHPRKLAIAEKISRFKKHLDVMHHKPSKKPDQK